MGNDMLFFTKVTKFCLIWSHWTPQSAPKGLSQSTLSKGTMTSELDFGRIIRI